MDSLKKRCLEYIRKNNKNLLRDAFENSEIPLDQIEDNLFDEIARYVNTDYKGVVRIIQIEKELLVKHLETEETSNDSIFTCQAKVIEFI